MRPQMITERTNNGTTSLEALAICLMTIVAATYTLYCFANTLELIFNYFA